MMIFKPLVAIFLLVCVRCLALNQSDLQNSPAPVAAGTGHKENRVLDKGQSVLAGYRIGAGDVLQIVVWKEPDVSVPSVVVRADGKISVPLIKDIEVLGMTPAEVETILAAKLSQFIHGADVTVVPKEIHSQKVYLIGAVKKEGPVILHSSMNVLQAIMEGGGLTEFAKPKKIYILRKVNGQSVRLQFNYNAVIKGEKTEENIVLLPEDIVVVPH